MKYEVLEAEKQDGITLEAAEAALAEEYPDYKVEVFDNGEKFLAKLTHKTAADDEEEVEDGPPAKKKPPFLEEKDDAGDDDGDEDGDEEDGEKKAPKPKDDDGDGDDLGFQDPDAGTSDVVKALKAVKTLEHALPKLKDQLKSLNGGEDVDGPGGPDGLPGGPPGAVPPPPGPPKGVGPTPGAPPGAALPGGGPGLPPPPGKGIPAPNVGHGLDLRKGPQPGPSTFSKVKDRVLFRPVANADGTRTNMHEAANEIAQNPRWADYYIDEVKFDEVNDQWVARLKQR